MSRMTTIYLEEQHFEFFKKHPEVSRSEVIRQALDHYIKNYRK